MIARGGAMALFVLRLAGLLSLEKSFDDNSTSLPSNSTALSNSSKLLFESSTVLPSNTFTPFIVTEVASVNSSLTTSNSSLQVPIFGLWITQSTALNESVKSLGELTLNNSRPLALPGREGLPAPNKTATGSKKNNSKQRKSNNYKDSSKGENKGVNKEEGRNGQKKGNLSKPKNRNSKAVKSYGGKELVESSTLPPRDSHTGFSPLLIKPVNNSELPYYANAPSKVPFVFDESETRNIESETPFVETVSPKSISSSRNSSNRNFLSLDAPETFFVDTGFDYDDYYGNGSSFDPPILSSRSLIIPVPRPGEEEAYKKYYETEKEKGKGEDLKYDDEEKKKDKNEVKEAADSEEENGNGRKKVDRKKDKEIKQAKQTKINEKGKQKKVEENKNKEIVETKNETKNLENSEATGFDQQPPEEGTIMAEISPTSPGKVNVTQTRRNNPYPYGPKFIPRIYIKNNSDAKSINVPEFFGNLFPEKDFLYNYDYEAPNSKEDQKEKFFVKTDKPPVLIHFDKPGYSPKLPESSLPPTRAPTPSDPWDCSPRCPRYILLDWNPDYDIRQYPVTTWISTVIIAENRILAELEGYMRVQDYFYGLNDRGKLLNITVPFVTQIKHGQHPGVLKEFTDFTVSLYIHHEDDPLNYDLPTPISNEVLIDRLESKTVFVSGFEAFVWEVTEAFLTEKVEKLSEKLRQNGEAFLDRYFYLASYNRPELYQPLYYEIWIYATTFRDNVALQVVPMAPRRRPPPNHITAKTVNKLCRGVECPSFEVLRTYRYGIQKRRYFDGVFVTTSPGVCQFSTLSVWKGFMPLHLYKHGINSHMEVIEATRPIALVHVKEDSTSDTECPQNMTMAIYLPKRLHSSPPLTGYDAPRVEVSALQDVVVYAYTVGGYLLEPDRVRKELADLKYRLTEFGACFKNDEYYVVVYDFIVRYHGRQNEIWVVAENCKATKNG